MYTFTPTTHTLQPPHTPYYAVEPDSQAGHLGLGQPPPHPSAHWFQAELVRASVCGHRSQGLLHALQGPKFNQMSSDKGAPRTTVVTMLSRSTDDTVSALCSEVVPPAALFTPLNTHHTMQSKWGASPPLDR